MFEMLLQRSACEMTLGSSSGHFINSSNLTPGSNSDFNKMSNLICRVHAHMHKQRASDTSIKNATNVP